MDLAVDEQGLWVLWGSTGNNGKLYASKIDVYRNVVTQTWTLNTGKQKFYYKKISEKTSSNSQIIISEIFVFFRPNI